MFHIPERKLIREPHLFSEKDTLACSSEAVQTGQTVSLLSIHWVFWLVVLFFSVVVHMPMFVVLAEYK